MRTFKHKTAIKTEDNAPQSDDIVIKTAKPGQHFHMNFGFVQVSKYVINVE